MRRLAFCLLLLLGLPLAAGAEDGGLESGRLWRLERAGSGTSWVFGTMHVSDPRVMVLPENVLSALAASRSLASELKLDETDLTAALQGMVLRDQRLSDLLPAELHQRALAALEAVGIPAALGDLLQPWAAAVVLSYGAEELERGRQGLPVLDAWLQEEAQRLGKTVIGLETLEEQLAIFASLPLAWQIDLLVTALDFPELMSGASETMTQLYLAGDLAGLWDYYQTMGAEMDPAFFAHFTEVAVVRRNHHMAERLEPLLRRGGLFVAVGAMHLAGEESLLRLLAARGYRVIRAD